MRKYQLGLIVLLIMVVMLSACTNNGNSENQNKNDNNQSTTTPATGTEASYMNEEGFPILTEPVKLTTMIAMDAGQNTWDKLWLSDHLNEKLGGTIDATEVDSQVWEEKLNLAFATGELPDYFAKASAFSAAEVLRYGKQGLLIPLNDLINEYAPNVRNWLDQYPDVEKSITFPDGNIYAFPGFSGFERELAVGRYWINSEWLDNVGMNVPTTLDEFYAVMKAFKEEDPNGNGEADEIPASGVFGEFQDIKMIVLTALGYNQAEISLDKSGTTVNYVPAEPLYKEYLSYMNKLYAEELLDPAFFSQNVQVFRGKAAEQRVGFFFDFAHFVAVGNDEYVNYNMFPPLTSEFNDTNMWPVKRYNTIGGMFSNAITNSNKYPEATMRLLDYMHSDEGGFLVRWGPDVGVIRDDAGIHWNEDGTWEVKAPEGSDSLNFRISEVTNTSVNFSNTQKISDTQMFAPNNISLTSNIMEHIIPYGKPIYPDVMFTDAELERIQSLSADLSAYAQQMEAKFIVGDTPLSDFEDYVDTLNDIGVEEYVKIHQDAFDRWNQ